MCGSDGNTPGVCSFSTASDLPQKVLQTWDARGDCLNKFEEMEGAGVRQWLGQCLLSAACIWHVYLNGI